MILSKKKSVEPCKNHARDMPLNSQCNTPIGDPNITLGTVQLDALR
jgi:hypothetical protein